ncbi:uncharacterized protein LOC144442053 [Glandiceps talaboti]
MADQSNSTETTEIPKEGENTPNDVIGPDSNENKSNDQWDAGFILGQEMMDTIPQVPTSEEKLLSLSDPPSYDNQGLGLEAGNSAVSVPECPSAMYGPFLPEEPEPQTTDVKDVDAEKGVCGLKNLGNTCFMNSGLQCLLSCPSICQYFLEGEKFSPESIAGRFGALIEKVWCGQYSVIHPSEFKETLGFVHGQFKDYRQHDGQEFLALLLDSLHEELNHAKTKQELEEALVEEEVISEDSSDLLDEKDIPGPSTSIGKCLILKGSEDDEESSRSEMSVSEQEDSMDMSASDADQQQIVNETNNMTKLPSIEEFYMKDVKTLNTNVLREDSPPPVIAVDSEKFPKNDKLPTSKQKSPLKNKVENRTETSPKSPRNKKSNLFAIKTNKLENLDPEDSAKIQMEVVEEVNEIDSIKRMKMDDNGTILKSLLLKGGKDLLQESKLDVFSVQQDLEDVDQMKLDLTMLKRKDTNLFANATSKFPISANNESCNILDGQDKLGKFASNSFTLELNMELEKPENCKEKGEGEGEEEEEELEEGESKENEELKGAESSGTVLKQVTFANNQTILPNVVDDTTLSKTSSCAGSSTSGFCASRQTRAEKEFFQAEKSWHKYLERNRSVIVDTFQGQFKSTVICSSCDHVSVTFEPFMYLSVPLPNAMERQIPIVWVPLNYHHPMKYLVNVIKTHTVKQLRTLLTALIFGENVPPPNDIIIAEVFNNHIARVLEDGTHLRYVNTEYRMIYAFEMPTKPELNMHPNNLYCTYGDFNMADTAEDSAWRTRDDDVITESGDVSTNIDDVTTENDDGCNTGGDVSDVVMQSAEKDSHTGRAQGDVFSNIGYFDVRMYADLKNCDPGEVQNSGHQSFPCTGSEWNVPSVSIPSPRNNIGSGDTEGVINTHSDDITTKTSDVSTNWVPNNADANMWSGDAYAPNNASNTNDLGLAGVSTDWRSCAVCLEELPDHELLTHMSCGGALCHVCLEATSKHYGAAGFQCPVCTAEVNPAEDFVAAPPPTDNKCSKRVLTIPVQFRYDYEDDGQRKMKLFGHPRMVYLANETQGETLFSAIERMLPFQVPYKIVLTDGQGYLCSRCMYNIHCTGCELVREVEISLQSGDHLTVIWEDITQLQLEYAEQVSDHESMKDLRSQDPLTIQDCFHAFTESELLDEHNPWFCPKCEQNQCARKTLTVWRYPDTLVVYLKRFVFHELCSTKLDNKVLFPINNFDVSGFISGPTDEALTYDLQSCVCHFGGVNAGHYTAFSKNPLTDQWYYYNDETNTRQDPCDSDSSSVYVLFYQRKSSQLPFSLPLQQPHLPQEDQKQTSSDITDGIAVDESKETVIVNHQEINQLLEQLKSTEQNETPEVVDSTQKAPCSSEDGFDFYS